MHTNLVQSAFIMCFTKYTLKSLPIALKNYSHPLSQNTNQPTLRKVLGTYNAVAVNCTCGPY